MILKDSHDARTRAAAIVSRGDVIAFRTDTFYGLGADPFNAGAVQKIRELKGREEAKPILLLISDLSEVKKFIARQSNSFSLFANRFWPGPITLIGAAQSGLPTELTAGTDTVGLRLPDDESVRAIVRECGGALTATSANLAGNAPARSAAEVGGYFPQELDLIIEGATVTATEPSTVVDLTGDRPRLIREGAIKFAEFADYMD